MQRVTLKEKGQITIPAQLREQLSARVGDVFDVQIEGGKLVFAPLTFTSKEPAVEPGIDIKKWIGAACGLYAAPADVEAFIKSERKSWD